LGFWSFAGNGGDAALYSAHSNFPILADLQGIVERKSELSSFDLEYIPGFGPDAGGEGERRRSEGVDVDVARPAEIVVFEMVGFEIRDGLVHVGLAGQKRLLEDDVPAAPDARDAADVVRQLAEQEFRSEGAW